MQIKRKFASLSLNEIIAMNKFVTYILGLFLIAANVSCAQDSGFYNLKTKTITGDDFAFSSLKGKKVMVVNTASKCGLTPQYEQLEALYQAYKDSNFVIIGFPANNFMSQEPGTNEDIAAFCTKNYGVSFQMMSKISVKGKDMDPVYEYLTQKKLNGKEDSNVKWNFQKYLFDETGQLVRVVEPSTLPNDPAIIEWITK